MKRLETINSERVGVVLVGAALLTTILLSLDFNLLEANLYDLRMSTGPQPAPSKDIVLVSIDNQTTEAMEEVPPLSLDSHARALEILEKAEPRAIGLVVNFNQVIDNNPELAKKEWMSRFVDSAKRMESRGIPVILGTQFDVTGEVLPPYPLSTLTHAIALIHKDGNVFAEDRITRRALSYLSGKPAFHLELARTMGAISAGHLPKGMFQIPDTEATYFYFRYQGNPANAGYSRVSMKSLLTGEINPQFLHNKTVLIGTIVKENTSDFLTTPYSKNPFQNPKLEIHAHILDSIIRNDGIRMASGVVNGAITFSMISFVLWWVMVSTPLYGMLSVIALAMAFYLTSHLFFMNGWWIRASQPLVGTFLGFYLAVPYRLIREYRKRWDFQRENRLLVQVEELKTNFVSLITHDLKTPVARIQGLAEVLTRNANSRLIPQDKETLGSIVASTEELNRFISSILELTKVESNRLHLNIESKDINQLIERSVEGFQTQARVQKIGITSNLEPIFPIKFDVNLISKVINNLIDNALKYSPPGSVIKVESRESETHVIVSVSDQGIGMSKEELDSLFTKFYRAKNDTTTQIAGTGLGLYLTKYFVEAHSGMVEVESEVGRGSTFKILLPIHQLNSLAIPKGLSRFSIVSKVRTVLSKKGE